LQKRSSRPFEATTTSSLLDSAWTKWNHVRTIAALASAASFTIGLAR
jgi:uncharacterized membrane protein